ncbi:MAG: hypothetical protein R3B99_37990 [Polyangiales bacterium]|nr:hypothetical protein [Planctomycetota bacterium]
MIDSAPARHLARGFTIVFALVGACAQGEDHGAWRAELFSEEGRAEPSTHAFEETIRRPERLRGIAAPGPDGSVVRVACFTCHGLLQVELSERAPTPIQPDVGGPHVGLTFEHGPLDCAHCHDASDPSWLHTADGHRLPTTEALELCAQCHGLQWTDFQHGAHGGMRGAWDLNAGPRERNHCVDCHDPHRPAFGQYRPMPPPRDRFVPTPPHRAHSEHGAQSPSRAEHRTRDVDQDSMEVTP